MCSRKRTTLFSPSQPVTSKSISNGRVALIFLEFCFVFICRFCVQSIVSVIRTVLHIWLVQFRKYFVLELSPIFLLLQSWRPHLKGQSQNDCSPIDWIDGKLTINRRKKWLLWNRLRWLPNRDYQQVVRILKSKRLDVAYHAMLIPDWHSKWKTIFLYFPVCSFNLQRTDLASNVSAKIPAANGADAEKNRRTKEKWMN